MKKDPMKKHLSWTAIFILLPLSFGCSTAEGNLKGVEARGRAENIPVREKARPDYLNLGREMYARGLFTVAEVQLNEAVKNDRKNPEAYCLLGMCRHKQGDHKSAVRFYRQAIRFDRDFAPAHNGIALTYFELGKKTRALNSFKKAVSCNPGNTDYLNNLGYFYMSEGSLEQAEMSFRQCIVMDPEYKLALNNLGICLTLAGRQEEALQTFSLIMSRARACNNVGAVYEDRGEILKAIKMYMQALSLEPEMAEARRNLERLNGVFRNPLTEAEG
jgi:Tfp pilus assembly protein PilF